jgi:chemosensory pili system protein ChpC
MVDVTDLSIHRAGKEKLTVQGEEFRAVHCLSIPLNDSNALLPNAAVAEVVAYNEPEPVNDAPNWLLGNLQWRDRKVPLVSLEAATGKDNAEKTGPRIAVLNTLNSNHKVPYIAILLQGIPSLTLVHPNNLKWDETNQSQGNGTIAGYIALQNGSAMIPDIDNLEQRIENLHV